MIKGHRIIQITQNYKRGCKIIQSFRFKKEEKYAYQNDKKLLEKSMRVQNDTKCLISKG